MNKTNYTPTIRTYSELTKLKSFSDRITYLKLDGVVGEETFGTERYLNQQFYRSSAWRSIRNEVIIRDNGCDLGIEGLDITSGLVIHHMNPVTIEDLIEMRDSAVDPEFLICCSFATHNAIHFGDDAYISLDPTKERAPNDTCPWRCNLNCWR